MSRNMGIGRRSRLGFRWAAVVVAAAVVSAAPARAYVNAKPRQRVAVERVAPRSLRTLGAARNGVQVVDSSATSVPVVRCHTRFGIEGRHTAPDRVAVRGHHGSVAGLVAYTNTDDFLIGPKGMRCAGAVGADGTAYVVAWPRGSAEPRHHSREAGLSLSVDPACVGCQAELACPFFPAFAKSAGFPCTGSVSAGERVERLSTTRVLFTDPPGVSGAGWPSGGSDPANGVVGFFGPRYRGRPEEVMAATCTLPAASRASCTTSLNDAIARY